LYEWECCEGDDEWMEWSEIYIDEFIF
jgi:hypothetical protein